MAFTNEQMEAISKEGSNIIVSAGAGSGKTAVLTERVINKLKKGIPVDRLLVLTFTNEAANEMKNRIRSAIIKNDLLDQLPLLESAYITTFDSYAFSVVKKYHYLLNLSSDIKIISSNIITIKKYELLDQIFLNMYGNDNFNNLINEYCLKDDKSIKKFIIDISNKLEILTDKDSYLDNYLAKFYSDEFITKAVSLYNKLIKDKIMELHDIYLNLINYLDDKMISKIDEYTKNLFNGREYAEYVLFNSMPTPRFTGLDAEGSSLKEEFKKKVCEIKELLRFNDVQEIKDSMTINKDNIKVILDIIKLLDKEISLYKNKYEIFEFNDISHMAIKIVKDNLSVRNELKEYFNEIMIDEYQDTSLIQEEFINYIANNNVYMVGDIKQAIYRFRNANPYIFKDKYERYSKNDGGIKIDLLKNFRSREEVLLNINELFNLIMDNDLGDADYLNSHNMVFGNTLYNEYDNKENNNLEIYKYDCDNGYSKEENELFIVAKDIKDKIDNKYQVFDKNTSLLRNIKYSDICILTDKNKYLPLYKKILEYHGIPSVIYMDQELTNDMVILVIKNLINLVIHVVNNNYDQTFKYLFTSVARSFIFSKRDDEIYSILNKNVYTDNDIINKCKSIDINMPLVSVINDIIFTFKIYDMLTILPDIEKNIVSIDNLIDIANSLSLIGYDISEFIKYIDDSLEMELPVKYNINTDNDNAVKIMNIHKSKGLEFNICYFTGLYNKFTIKEISSKYLFDNDYGIIMPYMFNEELKNSILRDLYIYKFLKEEISEKIRLFYVEVTRCREKMIMLLPDSDNNNSFTKLVPFLNRMHYRSFMDIIYSVSLSNKYSVNKSIMPNKNYNKLNVRNILDNDNKNKLINKEINIDYDLDINKHFSKENNDIIDKDKIKAMEYGTKMHEIFEYEDFRNPKNQYVINLLNKVDNNFINVYHEYEFSYSIDNINYSGVIDLIMEYDNYINIIDYKLKHVDDMAYIKQLSGYKNYIESISNKKVYTYLYSIIDDEVKEVACE